MEWINDGGNHLQYALLICSPVIRTVIKAVSQNGAVVLWGGQSHLDCKDLYY